MEKIDYIEEIVREIKEEIKYIRNEALNRIHLRIDTLHLWLIILVVLVSSLLGIEGFKKLLPLLLK